MPHRWAIFASFVLACRGAMAQPTPDKPDAAKTAEPTQSAVTPVPADERQSEAAAALEPKESSWQIDLEPAAWFVGASGRVRLPRSTPVGRSNDKTVIEDLNFDNPRFVPFGEVNVRKGNLRFALRGFYYNAEKNASGNSLAIGDITAVPSDTLRSNLSFGSYELEAAYTVAGNRLNPDENGIYAVAAKFDLVGGARVYNTDWHITNLGSNGTGTAQTSGGGTFLQPELGCKLNIDLWGDLTLDLQTTFGVDPSSVSDRYSGDIIAGIMYRPTPHVGVQIGYRALFFGVSKGVGEGEFSFNGAFQGLYGGLDLRF